MYTTNGTYFAAAFQRLNLNVDKWRILFATGLGNINLQYWQELTANGGSFIGFSTDATFMIARVDCKVYKKLYAGLNVVFSNSETEYELEDIHPENFEIIRFIQFRLNTDGNSIRNLAW